MTTDRCPACGGAVRPGAPWCTLCWADLRPAPAPPPPAPAPVPAPTVPAVPVAPVPVHEVGWPLPGDVPLGVAAASLLTAPVTPMAPVAPLAPAVPALVPGVDPLTAPLGVLLGQQPVAPGPQAPVVTWPCVECGEANHLDLDTCGVCTAPFGGRIQRLDDVKGTRRRHMLIGLGSVLLFLMLLATLTFASTDATTVDPGAPAPDPAVENPIDYSSLPEG